MAVETRRDDGDRMPARAQPTHRLVGIAIAAQVVGQEQVSGEQNRFTHPRHAASWWRNWAQPGRAPRRPKIGRRAPAAARSRARAPATASFVDGGGWETPSGQWSRTYRR